MALVQTVHLSMANFKSAPVVPAVQNDTDRQVKMIIDDYTLTSGLTGKIAFERSDGTHYEASATLDTATNSFTADIDQALTQPGRTMVQLKVTDTLTVSTFSFVIFVEADNSGTVTPQEGIDLVTAVAAAEDAADRAESAVSEIALLDIFEMGNITITNTGWAYSDSTTRVRTVCPIYLSSGQKIGLKDYQNARYYLGWLTPNGTYGTDGWRTSDFTVSVSGYYVVLICNSSDTAQTDKTALASLFFGYSLNDKVDDLHTEVNLSTSDGWMKTKFEPKQFNASDGEFYDSSTRLSITQKQYLKDGGYVLAKPGYYVSVLQFNPDYTLKSDSGWQTGIAIPADSLVCILMRRVDNGNISAEECENCLITVNNFSTVPEVESKAYISGSDNVKGISHRGWYEAPENTLAAYRESRKHGFKYVECDVQFTSDNVPVLLHDISINRTARNSDGTSISGTVNISSITYAQSQNYDFGIYKGLQYAGEKIPKFEDFVKLCRSLGVHPYIEIKADATLTESQVSTLVSIVKSNGMKKNVTWISSSKTYLEYVQKHDPFARLGYVIAVDVSDAIIGDIEDLRDVDTFTSSDKDIFIDADYSALTATGINKCISNEVDIEVWTVDSELTIRGLDSYITGVTSDNLNAPSVLYSSNIH